MGEKDQMMNLVVQFNEKHKWCGCLGIVESATICGDDIRYLVGVPVPDKGIAYIFSMDSAKEIEPIGDAIFVPNKGEKDENSV